MVESLSVLLRAYMHPELAYSTHRLQLEISMTLLPLLLAAKQLNWMDSQLDITNYFRKLGPVYSISSTLHNT